MQGLIVLNRKGSLLIEVLLTVVVISVSLTIIIGGLLSGYRVSLLNSDYSQGLFLLENQMAWWRSQGFSDLTVQEDSAAGWSEKFHMEVKADPVMDAGGPALKCLSASLQWKAGSRNMKMPVATFFPESVKP